MSMVNGFIKSLGFNDACYVNNKRKLIVQNVLTTKIENEIHRIFRENEYDCNWKPKFKEAYPITIILSNFLAALILIIYAEYRYKLHTNSKRKLSSKLIGILMVICSYYETHQIYCDTYKKLTFSTENELLCFLHFIVTSNYTKKGVRKQTDGSICLVLKILTSMHRFEIILKNSKCPKNYYHDGELKLDIVYECISAAIHKEKLQEKYYKSADGGVDEFIFSANLRSKILPQFPPLIDEYQMSLSPSKNTNINESSSNNELEMLSPPTNNSNHYDNINKNNFDFTFSDDDTNNNTNKNTNNNNDNNNNDEYAQLGALYDQYIEERKIEKCESDINSKLELSDDEENETEISPENLELLKKIHIFGYPMKQLQIIFKQCSQKKLFDDKTESAKTNILLNYLKETE
eukprot:389761_1